MLHELGPRGDTGTWPERLHAQLSKVEKPLSNLGRLRADRSYFNKACV